MPHDVFISYSTKDDTLAKAACATLEGHDIRCWMAPRNIPPGADWSESIVDAIAASQVMVLIFSQNANESPQVRREVQRAFERDLLVIPLRVQNVTPTKSLEYYISAVHWLDALTPPIERHLEDLARRIRSVLGQTVPSHADEGSKVASPSPPVASDPSPEHTSFVPLVPGGHVAQPTSFTQSVVAMILGAVGILLALGLMINADFMLLRASESPASDSPPSEPLNINQYPFVALMGVATGLLVTSAVSRRLRLSGELRHFPVIAGVLAAAVPFVAAYHIRWPSKASVVLPCVIIALSLALWSVVPPSKVLDWVLQLTGVGLIYAAYFRLTAPYNVPSPFLSLYELALAIGLGLVTTPALPRAPQHVATLRVRIHAMIVLMVVTFFMLVMFRRPRIEGDWMDRGWVMMPSIPAIVLAALGLIPDILQRRRG